MRRDMAVLVDDYLAGRLARGEISPRTRRLLASRLATLVRTCPSCVALDRQAVLRWAGSLHLDHSSRRAYVSSVRVFAAWLVAEGHLELDPTVGLARVREPPRLESRALSVKAVRALFGACPDSRGRAIVALMVGCGLRCCEVASLEMADWDRDDGSILVRGKAGHMRRLPVPDEVEAPLVEYLADRGYGPGPVIASRHAYRYGLSAAYLSALLGRWLTVAGVKERPGDGRSAHALRHTCASDVYKDSKDLRAVQEMLGHQNLNTTALYLRHTDLRRLRVAMAGRRYAASA